MVLLLRAYAFSGRGLIAVAGFFKGACFQIIRGGFFEAGPGARGIRVIRLPGA
jgi:hypothetical protein